MLRKLMILVLVVNSSIVLSQNWQDIGGLQVWPPRCFYEDTTEGVLYIGGSFYLAGSDTVAGIVKWDGHQFTPLGCGVNWDCTTWITPNTYGGYVHAIAKYKGEIYVGGTIALAGGKHVNNIARWNGTEWDSVSSGVNNTVNMLEVIDDVLYVGGGFKSAGGISVNGLAKWDGTTWSDVYGFPDFCELYNIILCIRKYKNELYVGGNFGTYDCYDSLMDIAKYDGINWVKVGGSMHGGMSGLVNMQVYNEELYISGAFYKLDGNIGNFIQKWDGVQWKEVGGSVWGVYGDLYSNGQIHDMKVKNNELYIGGVFHYAGNAPISLVAKWDGSKWCGFGGNIDNGVNCLGFLHDTLYIGGGFRTIDGDSMNFLAQWIGGNYIDTCSTLGINEIIPENDIIQIFPNPATNTISINMSSRMLQNATTETEYKIINKLGQQVKTGTIKDFPYTVSIEDLNEGLYVLILQSDRFNETRKFVKMEE